jgi:RNA polymerase nonessential primary-like sigma factor
MVEQYCDDDTTAKIAPGSEDMGHFDLQAEPAEAQNVECSRDLTQLYLAHVGKKPLLSRDEERHYATLAKSGDFSARQKMIEHNLRLVVSIAKHYVNKGVSFLDLIEEGNLGLIHSLDKFDPNRGFRFSTYACWWIRAAIKVALSENARTVRLPVHVIRDFNQILKAKSTFAVELREGRSPSSKDIGRLAGMEPSRVENTLSLMCDAISIDAPNDVEGQPTLAECLVGYQDEEPEQQYEQLQMKRLVLRHIERLPDKERFVIKCRFGFDEESTYTLDSIAKVMGVTPERVRQIQSKALRGLHRSLSEHRIGMN